MKCKIACCCTCANQKQLMKHPGNASEFARGSISDHFGYICIATFEDEVHSDKAYFFDAEHGECELYTPKLKINDNTSKD